MTNANPFKIPESGSVGDTTEPIVRSRFLMTFGLPLILGPICGVFILVSLIISNAHGGFSLVGSYLLGPSVWIGSLVFPDGGTVFVLMVAQCIVWISYWWLLLIDSPRLTRALRITTILLVHFGSVAVYHFAFGLP